MRAGNRSPPTSPALIRFLQKRAGVTDRVEFLRQGMTTTLQRLAAAAVSAETAGVEA